MNTPDNIGDGGADRQRTRSCLRVFVRHQRSGRQDTVAIAERDFVFQADACRFGQIERHSSNRRQGVRRTMIVNLDRQLRNRWRRNGDDDASFSLDPVEAGRDLRVSNTARAEHAVGRHGCDVAVRRCPRNVGDLPLVTVVEGGHGFQLH